MSLWKGYVGIEQDNALAQTTNFVTLYLHACGISEVPQNYHMWSCLSFLSAALENRIWFEKHKKKKLLPNIYVFLVGPGSLGKGHAIGSVYNDLHREAKLPNKVHPGKITSKGLIDVMTSRVETNYQTGEPYMPYANIWVITDELKSDIGTGHLAADFISTMTQMYTGYFDTSDTTRTHGSKPIQKPCPVWTAGTTEEWLMQVFTQDDIYSGAAARIVFSFEDYGPTRYWRAEAPKDEKQVMDYLVARSKMLPYIEGQIYMTDKAEDFERSWYLGRRSPNDRAMWPAWKRGHDLALKLAMLFAVADGGPLVINYNHIFRATELVKQSQDGIARLFTLAGRSPETISINYVENLIRKKKRVTHTRLLNHVSSTRGIKAEGLRRYINEAVQKGLVRRTTGKYGGVEYVWIEREEKKEDS